MTSQNKNNISLLTENVFQDMELTCCYENNPFNLKKDTHLSIEDNYTCNHFIEHCGCEDLSWKEAQMTSQIFYMGDSLHVVFFHGKLKWWDIKTYPMLTSLWVKEKQSFF